MEKSLVSENVRLTVQNSQLLEINRALNNKIDEMDSEIKQLKRELSAEWKNLKTLSKSIETKKTQ